MGRLDLDQCDVGAPVRADQLAAQLALVGERHVDVVGALDHVMVGEDVAVGRDDETRTDAARHLFARPRAVAPRSARTGTRTRREEAAEEVVERVVLVESVGERELRQLRTIAVRALGGADVHDGRPDLLDEVGEIGQARPRRGLRHRRRRPSDHAGGNDGEREYGKQLLHAICTST